MPLARNHMSRSLLTVEPGLGLKAVAERMVAKDVGAVLVIDNGRLVGILTERDIMRAVAGGITDETLVSDWMTRQAAVLMIHGGFRHMPIMDGDEVVGMLSIRDLMRIVLEDAAPRGA